MEPVTHRFRFCVIADGHFCPKTAITDRAAIEDINGLMPDYTVVLGDISGWPGAGSEELTRRAVEELKALRMPWHNLIGNHDMEDRKIETDRENVLMWLRLHDYKFPWHCEERGPIAFLFLSTERFREHTIQQHEIYLTSRQLSWASDQLKRLADRPVVIACHAPVLGSNLCVKPELHVRSGNAYVNQNHIPGQIMDLCHRNKNVLFWLSGHSHMSQAHPGAIVNQLGIHFVHCGTTSIEFARDQKRHSRVVDVEADRIIIRTFDHDQRAMDDSLERVIPGTLAQLMETRRTMKLCSR